MYKVNNNLFNLIKTDNLGSQSNEIISVYSVNVASTIQSQLLFIYNASLIKYEGTVTNNKFAPFGNTPIRSVFLKKPIASSEQIPSTSSIADVCNKLDCIYINNKCLTKVYDDDGNHISYGWVEDGSFEAEKRIHMIHGNAVTVYDSQFRKLPKATDVSSVLTQIERDNIITSNYYYNVGENNEIREYKNDELVTSFFSDTAIKNGMRLAEPIGWVGKDANDNTIIYEHPKYFGRIDGDWQPVYESDFNNSSNNEKEVISVDLTPYLNLHNGDTCDSTPLQVIVNKLQDPEWKGIFVFNKSDGTDGVQYLLTCTISDASELNIIEMLSNMQISFDLPLSTSSTINIEYLPSINNSTDINNVQIQWLANNDVHSIDLLTNGNGDKVLCDNGQYDYKVKPGCIYLSQVSGGDTAGNYLIGTACEYMIEGKPFVILCAPYGSSNADILLKIWFSCPETYSGDLINTQSYSTSVKPDITYVIHSIIDKTDLP